MSSGGGGNWIGGLVGGISAGAGVRGYNNQVGKSNAYYNQIYGPSSVNSYAQQMNPWVWAAINGQQAPNGQQATGFSKDLYNILQGKDISPYLLNQPLNQLNQGANQNLAQFQSLVGRNNSGGGLANAYGLANLAGKNTAVANLMNQYGQWREQQRRSDINWGLNQIGQSQDRGQGIIDRIAQSHQFKKNFWQKLSAFGAGYASGEGGTQAPAAPTNQTAYNGTRDSWGNVPSPTNSTPNYQDPVQYPYGATNGQYTAPNVGGSTANPYPGSASSIQTGSTPNWWNQQYGGYMGGGV